MSALTLDILTDLIYGFPPSPQINFGLLLRPGNDRFEIRANFLLVSHHVTCAKIVRASQTEPQSVITSNEALKIISNIDIYTT